MLAIFVCQERALVPLRTISPSAGFTIKQGHFRSHSQITKTQERKYFIIRLSHTEGNLYPKLRRGNYVDVLE